MADLRKRPRPHPASGKRPRRHGLIFAAAMALASVAPIPSALGQDSAEVLRSGTASFSSGKYELAVRQFTAALNSDTISESNMAKGLYYRGLAYQRLGQSSRAIADLGAAIWLGLPASERLSALVNRSIAYRSAGLTKQAEAEISRARKEGSRGEVERLLAESGRSSTESAAISSFATEVRSEPAAAASAPSSARREAATQQAEAPPSPPESTSSSGGNRLSRWWGAVTGSSAEDSAPAPSEPAPAPAATASAWTTSTRTASAEPTATSVPSNWSTETRAASPASRPAAPSAWTTETRADAAPRVAAAGAAAAGGDYRLQLSPTRSEEEARALWQNVVRANRQFASLQPRIEATEMGNLGTFYRIQIGPFQDKAESLKLCNALKRSGVDCFLVTP